MPTRISAPVYWVIYSGELFVKFRLSPIAGAVLALHALPGAAQSTDAPPAESVAEEPAQRDAPQLREVKVEAEVSTGYKVDAATSSKFTAPLRDTPKSVTVISSQVLQDSAATSLQDALRFVPGITFLAGEGGQALSDRPVIRGLNSSSSVFIDGIRDIGTQTRDVFALESVEVTKGADSAYGGRGSGGGNVNLVTKQARAESFATANLAVGTSDTLRGTIDRNWTINDSTAFRLNVMGNTGVVPGRDDAVDYDKWGAAGSLAFGLGSKARTTVDYYLLRDSGMPDYSIPYDPETGLPVTETKGVDAKTFYGMSGRDFRDAESDVATIKIERELDDGVTVRNTTRYGRTLNSYVVTNPDDNKQNVKSGYLYRATKQRWAQTDTIANVSDLSVSFDTAFIKHALNAGVEFSREKREQDGWTVNGTSRPAGGTAANNCVLNTGERDPSTECTDLYHPNPNDVWLGTIKRTGAPTNYTTDAMAVYVFDTLKFDERWQLNLGLRWDNYKSEADRKEAVNSAGTTVAAQYAATKDDFLNYQVGLVFKPVEEGTLYVSYATESTPASLGTADEDGVSAANADLKPEESATAEIGAKWEFFDHQLLLTFALFEGERKNARIETSANTFVQVGKTQVRGAELGLSGQITPDWKLFGGYSYLDSELVRGAFNNLAVGKSLPNTAENSLSLYTTYQVLPKLQIGGGAYYVSEVYGSYANGTPGSVDKRVPDYWRFDAMAGYAINPTFSVQLNIQNLTDEVYYTKAYANHYAALGTGRQGLLSLNMSF